MLASHLSPTVAELARLGVARISIGSGTYLAAISEAQRVADEILGVGTFAGLAQRTITHADAQQLLGS